jgi:hypothetical protein
MSLGADLMRSKKCLVSLRVGCIWCYTKTKTHTGRRAALGWPAQVPIYDSKKIKSYDWLDAASRQGLTQNHQFAVSAGTDKSRFVFVAWL